MKAIKLRYEECHCNDSLRKAFYGSVFGLRVKDQTTATVSLKSPFSTLEVLTTDHLLTKDHETVEVEVTLSHPEIEKQPLVFTAGRAWLRQNPDHHLG
jgi:hypothetical protein